MKIAFDWQGTLDVNPILVDMAQRLKSTGAEVCVISAMPENRPHEREAEVRLMRELGIELYVDDNPEVVATMRAAGFKVLHIA